MWETAAGYRISRELPALNTGLEKGDALRLLVDEVLGQHVRLGRRGLAVCAAAPGVGVTFVSANLAIGLAEAEVGTLLIDANLDRPGLTRLIEPTTEGPGLRQLMADPDLSLDAVVHQDVLPGLSVLYAGPANGIGPQDLSSERFSDIMNQCLRRYECTLVDAPAASRSAGARSVAIAAGYALLVAQKGVSFADDVGLLTTQLQADEVLIVGSVLNRE